ncbi:MAG: multicopper oxidase domain-containing protein [Deltaproteobacteria bacterium]
MLIVSGTAGSEVALLNAPYEPGHDTGHEPPLPVAKFVVPDDVPIQACTPSIFADIEPLRTARQTVKWSQRRNTQWRTRVYDQRRYLTFFQISSTHGVRTAPEALASKDTVNIPQMTTPQLVARFDKRGRWMSHCHILEQAAGGMMGTIDVEGASL